MSSKIKKFIKLLLSTSEEVSSKRVWGSLTFLSAIILSYTLLLKGDSDIPENKLYLLISMYIFGSIILGLGIFDKIKSIKTNL